MSKHLDIVWTNQFKKDYKLAMKRHLDIGLLDDIIRKLASSEQLPEKNKDHALTGTGSGIVSATFSRIGYWSIGLRMICSS